MLSMADGLAPAGTGKLGSDTRPGSPGQVRVLQTKLQSALRSVVRLVPEAGGAFDDVLGVGGAIRQAARAEAGGEGRAGQRLDTATGVVER